MSVDVVESSVQYSISTTQVKSVKVQVERLTILGSPGETDSDRGLGWSYFGTLLFEPQTALCLNIAPKASVYAQIDRLLIDVLQALALLMPRTILKTSIHQFSLSRWITPISQFNQVTDRLSIRVCLSSIMSAVMNDETTLRGTKRTADEAGFPTPKRIKVCGTSWECDSIDPP